jgi:cell division protein FtsQ
MYFYANEGEKVCTGFEIGMIDNEKIQLITQKDIALLLEENNLNPIGKTIKDIRKEAIEATLLKNPMIKKAECFQTPSGYIYVKVLQRTPKFRVVGLGSYYMDTDRNLMPVSTNNSAYVPVVSGRITVSMAKGKMFDFITYLEQNPFWNDQIEQIFVRNDQKIELVPRVGDAIIVLGKLDNYASKLEKLRKLYVNGFNVIGWNRYKIIDLQYKDQVVCTKIGPTPKKRIIEIVEKKDSVIASKL